MVRLTAPGSMNSERATPVKLFASTARTKIFIAWMVVLIDKARPQIIVTITFMFCRRQLLLRLASCVTTGF